MYVINIPSYIYWSQETQDVKQMALQKLQPPPVPPAPLPSPAEQAEGGKPQAWLNFVESRWEFVGEIGAWVKTIGD